MNKKRPWPEHFMLQAVLASEQSDDIHTQVGCVIIGPDKEPRSSGCNGLPRRVKSLPYRLERPTKYHYMAHAEQNAIGNAALHGASTKGCTMYVTHRPCYSCAQLLIQSGIVRVYYGTAEVKSDTPEAEIAVLAMFEEAGVELIAVNNVLTG